MKNITVTVDDETYRLSRAWAAKSGTTVPALIRAYLTELTEDETATTRFERLRRLQDTTLAEIQASGSEFRAADNLPRDALYDRNALR